MVIKEAYCRSRVLFEAVERRTVAEAVGVQGCQGTMGDKETLRLRDLKSRFLPRYMLLYDIPTVPLSTV